MRADIAREGREQYAAWLRDVQREAFRPSALNLAHYLALRRRDLRELQVALMPFGLSSLGRCESRVLPNLDAAIAALSRFVDETDPPPFPSAEAFFAGETLLQRAAEDVFGPTPATRTVRIMVTLPSEAAVILSSPAGCSPPGRTRCASTARMTTWTCGARWLPTCARRRR